MEEVAGGCIKFYNKDFYDLSSTPNIIRFDQIKKNEMGRPCGTYEKRCIQGFSGETWGKENTWKTQA